MKHFVDSITVDPKTWDHRVHNASIPVLVYSYEGGDEEPKQVRFSDYKRKEEREWLHKHTTWAISNGVTVMVEPLVKGDK